MCCICWWQAELLYYIVMILHFKHEILYHWFLREMWYFNKITAAVHHNHILGVSLQFPGVFGLSSTPLLETSERFCPRVWGVLTERNPPFLQKFITVISLQALITKSFKSVLWAMKGFYRSGGHPGPESSPPSHYSYLHAVRQQRESTKHISQTVCKGDWELNDSQRIE